MFEGVYCKEKNSNTVSESILIDSFNNCIDSALNPQSCVENLSDSRSTEMSTASDRNSDSKSCSNNTQKPLSSCVAGQNVRATYSADGKLYEAVVINLFGKPLNIKALVRYHGYGNEEAVDVKLLFPSLGPAAIKKQIECAKLEEGNDKQTSNNKNVQKEINWKKGMVCGALYEKTNLIYEGTVLEVNDSERTADIEMIGYGTRFQAKFENMRESNPEYRVKQASAAQKFIDAEIIKLQIPTRDGDRPSLNSLAPRSSCPVEKESSGIDLKEKVDVTDSSKEPKPDDSNKNQSSESLSSDGVYLKEAESNCAELEAKVDVSSDISKESKLNCTNENEQETLASDGAVLKENKSNSFDSDAEVDVPSDILPKPKLECINEQLQNSNSSAAGKAHFEKHQSNSTDFETEDDVAADASNEPKLCDSMTELTDVLTESHLPLSLRNDGILQPESEAEALACLLSANYLSGYYAGYYDSIRKRQNVDKSGS